MNLSDLTIHDAKIMLKKKSISSVELTKYYIEKIKILLKIYMENLAIF